MVALRVARTVTARDKIVYFTGDYHGTFDEVLQRATAHGAAPIAPGIMTGSAGNVMVLEYGSEKSLEWIRAHGSEIAAVLVEPMQSRHPEVQPREFLHELRGITAQAGTALIFDEVVTGFRVAPGGAQEYYGIRADLATYGKVIGRVSRHARRRRLAIWRRFGARGWDDVLCGYICAPSSCAGGGQGCLAPLEESGTGVAGRA